MRNFEPLIALPRMEQLDKGHSMAPASDTRAALTSPSVARNRDPKTGWETRLEEAMREFILRLKSILRPGS